MRDSLKDTRQSFFRKSIIKEEKKTEHTNISPHLQKLRHQNIHVMLSYAKRAKNQTTNANESCLEQLSLCVVW